MKKYIIYLLCLFTVLFSGMTSTSAKHQIPEPELCYTLWWEEYRGTLHETWRMPGNPYYYSYSTNCTKTYIQYYSLLAIIFIILSGIWYIGYKKYKAKKLISNIESKNTSPVNPE